MQKKTFESKMLITNGVYIQAIKRLKNNARKICRCQNLAVSLHPISQLEQRFDAKMVHKNIFSIFEKRFGN